MIRILAILLLSCVTLRAAAPYFVCNTTNELISIHITPKNNTMLAFLSGLATTNSNGALFMYDTNSTATVDWVNVFKPASQNGRWKKVEVFDVTIGFRIGGAAASGNYLVGNGTSFVSTTPVTLTAGSGLTGGGTIAANRTFTVGAGTGITVNADDVALSAATITSLGLADTSVQPARQIISGGGLTGGGDLSADRTLAVGAGTGITVAADTVLIDQTFSPTWTGKHSYLRDTAQVVDVFNTGDSNSRFTMLSIGTFHWGSGSAATDTTIQRTGAGELKLDDFLVVDGLTASRVVATDSNKRLVSLPAPAADGYVLSSTIAGVQTWVAQGAPSSFTLTAGNGLTGTTAGAVLAAATMTVGAGTGITVNSDDVAVNQAFAPDWTGFHSHQFNGMGTTPDDTKGVLLYNATAAAAGAQQISPALRFAAKGWKTDATAASRDVTVRNWLLPVQGAANPSGTFKWQSSINGGAYSDILSVSTGGAMIVPSATVSGALNVAGSAGANAIVSTDVSGNVQGISNTRGAIAVGGIVNWTSLPIGASGKVLKSDGTDASWQNQTSVGTRIYSITAESGVTNSSTIASFLVTGVGSKTIAGDTFAAGAQVRIRLGGFYATKAITPGTFTISFNFGVAATDAIILSGFPAAVSAQLGTWWAEYNYSVNSIGVTGKIMGQGSFTYTNPLVTDVILGGGAKKSATTVDTTIDNLIEVSGTWQTADPANGIACTWATIELSNN